MANRIIHDVCCAGCLRGMSSAKMSPEATVPLCRKCIPTKRAVAVLDGDVECSECGCRFSDAELGLNAATICAHCAHGIPRADVIVLATQAELLAEEAA